MENKFIPCSNGQQAQMECLYRIAGSLVEVVGFPIAHYTPQDARSAAQTLWAMADHIEGKKTPRSDAEAVVMLVDATGEVLRSARLADLIVGSDEVLVVAPAIHALEKALNTLTGESDENLQSPRDSRCRGASRIRR